MAKFAASGCILKRGAVVVAQVRSIAGPGLSLELFDTTTHDSTAGYRDFVPSFIDPGEITLEILFDPDNATHTSLRTDLVARAATTYSVTFVDPTPAVWSFSAYVTGFSPNAPVDGELTAAVTLKVTGAITVS